MRRFLLTLLVLTALLSAPLSPADTVYMVLEQDSSGVARHHALDQSSVGDAIDPVILHIILNHPTDVRTAQVLWTSSNFPIVWDHNSEENDFRFVEHAVLPADAKIEYRVLLHRYNIELMPLRHTRLASAKDYGIDPAMMGQLPEFEYNIEAHLIMPDRPKQVMTQRVTVVGNPGAPAPGSEPEPNPTKPEPKPLPPNVGAGGGGPTAPPLAPGFTPVNKASDTKIVYVSSSEGNDANDGASPKTPVKTLARGVELIRGGKPDWLLLKAGDTWLHQSFKDLDLSGKAPDRPLVIGAYGDGPRPVIIPPHGEHGLKTINHQIKGMVIQGLHFYAATRDKDSNLYQGRPGDVDGINIRLAGGDGKYVEGLVIEDCKITHFDTNIKLVDDWSRKQGEGVPGRIHATVRRNIIQYASSSDSHSVGIYIEGSRDSVIEQNLLDHNGWAQTDGVEKRNKASHNIYAQWANGPLTIRHNYITRGAAHGLQLRAGGDIEHNLFVRNAMAFFTSMSNSKANYNVILESDDMDIDTPSERRGYGINGWDLDYYEVIGNVVARRVGSLQKPGIDVSAKRVIIRDNAVYDWQDRRVSASISYYGGNDSVVRNNLAKELNGGKEPSFVDPTRGLASYAGTIGLEPSNEAFLNYLAERPRGTWDTQIAPDTVADYVREGFRLKN